MLGGVSSVLRIGMDSKSQLDGPVNTRVTPANDLTLNNTRTGKFNFGIHTAATAVNDDLLPATGGQDRDENGQILIQEQRPPESPYRAAQDVASLLPSIVSNAGIQSQHAAMYRRDHLGRNYSQMRSSDIRRARNGLPDSPSKVVQSRNGHFAIDQDYIDRRQSEIEAQIYAKKQAKTTQAILDRHKYAPHSPTTANSIKFS